MPTPPPLPDPSKPQPIDYAGTHRPAPAADSNQAQKVFDTVVGPNLRLRDNLIQLACVVIGAGVGGGVGFLIGKLPGMAVGIIGGLIVSLLVSGAVIGVIRLITSSKSGK